MVDFNKHQFVYNKAVDFLTSEIDKHFLEPKKLLNKYLNDQSKYENINDANKRLIESMSNRNMMPSVIAFKKRESKIKEILFDYNPVQILSKYINGDTLLNAFKNNFDIKNLESKKNLWKIFSDGVISGSNFLSSFRNKQELDLFINTFSLNKYTKASLPMLLSKEIYGFGFALSCDFLKELGFREYPKPDIHLIEIFYQTGLCSSKEPYDVYKSIIEMCEIVGEDAYTVDKIFWLIGSGNFYLDNIKIPRNRDKFISLVNKNRQI